MASPFSRTFTQSPRNVFSNSWIRQETEDGRVYFFNTVTGASQWHIPNELYRAQFTPRSLASSSSSTPFATPRRRLKKEAESLLGRSFQNIGRKMVGPSKRETFTHPVLMPGSAKACRSVDCVTEFFLTQTPAESSVIASMMSTFTVEEKKILPELEERPVISILIKGARGLRDTDFHPGVDKSDPYCVCEIVDKPESKISTCVVNDCLDPVWDHLALIGPYAPGDQLAIKIYDYDPGQETLGGDDLLGTVTLDGEDMVAKSGPTEYELNDPMLALREKTTSPHVTLEAHAPCVAWPSLTGMDTTSAKEILNAVRPDLSVELLDAVPEDETYPVVSWDNYHKHNGYKGCFFGAFEDDVRFFKEGDSLEVFPKLRRAMTVKNAKLVGTKSGRKTFVFKHIAGETGKQQMVGGKIVRYLYFQGEGLDVTDGVQWRRIPKKCAQGFFSNRVCLYSDPKTNTVVGLIGNG